MGKILLIVDDLLPVARGLQRLVKGSFDAVFLAETPEEAERWLADPNQPISHVVCDYYLGSEVSKTGADLIAKWRGEYPTIQSAVLMTGSDLEALSVNSGVDRIFRKPLEMQDLVSFLKNA